MADYYPLLARALEALPDRSPALRTADYDRARNALVAQLRSLDPPVSEDNIALERKALDTAIERLETLYAEPPATEQPPIAERPPELPEADKLPAAQPFSAPPKAAEPAHPPFTPPPEPIRPGPSLPPALPPEIAKAANDPLPEPEAPPRDFIPVAAPNKRATDEPAQAAAAGPVETAAPGEAQVIQQVIPGEAVTGTTQSESADSRKRPRIEVVAPRVGRSRLVRNLLVGGVLAIVIGAIAAAAFFLRDNPSDLQSAAGPESQETAPSAPPDTKFADRVGGEQVEPDKPKAAAPKASPSDVTVAQRAILYEENPADTKGAPVQTQGHAVWRIETLPGEQGQPLQNAVQATVSYPDAGLTLVMTIRRNTDANLPASHMIELAFTASAPGGKRDVQEIGLLQAKDDEAARGSPVSGLPVRVRDNFFLIGLSNLASDVERNTDLLLNRHWFDLAIRYKAGGRAVVTFEKGSPGAQVMQTAFDQWRQ